MSDDFVPGDRVYVVLINEVTQERRERWGTVESMGTVVDDLVDVRFDNAPEWVQPVTQFVLFKEGEEDEVAP